MAKVLEGYAYTTGDNHGTSRFLGAEYVDTATLESPKAFSKDLSTPIWLNHQGPTEATLLDAFHTSLGMYIKVLVRDGELAEKCRGFSIGYTRGGLKKGKLDEISILCGDDRRPGNPSCTVNCCRDPTPEEIGPLENGRNANMKTVNIDPMLTKIASMQSICGKALREIRDAGKTPEQLHEEKMANRRKLLGQQDEVNGMTVKELRTFRKSMAAELDCEQHLIMFS